MNPEQTFDGNNEVEIIDPPVKILAQQARAIVTGEAPVYDNKVSAQAARTANNVVLLAVLVGLISLLTIIFPLLFWTMR